MCTQLLVADSDVTVLANCRSYFSNYGFQVEVAADGLECLAALRRLSPDVLVLQYELLWGGGDGVLDWLRNRPSYSPDTVILTRCGSAVDARLPRTAQSSIKAVVRQPYSMRTLLETIRLAHDKAAIAGR